MGPQQRLDPGAERRILAASPVEVGGPLGVRLAVEGGREERQQVLVGVAHGCLGWSSTYSAPFGAEVRQTFWNFFSRSGSGSAEGVEQPGPCEGPLAVGRAPGQPERDGRLVEGQA